MNSTETKDNIQPLVSPEFDVYRVAELNSHYACGWIYVTNQILGYEAAEKFAEKHKTKTGFETRIDRVSENQHN